MGPRAQQFAARVRRRLAFDRPPGNPALLLAYAPLEVMTLGWSPELSAVLVLRHNRVLSGLNKTRPPARRHFSFWHEIGHYLMHQESLQLCQGEEAWANGPEREANDFATNLLMPAQWVREAHRVGGNVKARAREFGVSPQAMGRRLRELDMK